MFPSSEPFQHSYRSRGCECPRVNSRCCSASGIIICRLERGRKLWMKAGGTKKKKGVIEWFAAMTLWNICKDLKWTLLTTNWFNPTKLLDYVPFFAFFLFSFFHSFLAFLIKARCLICFTLDLVSMLCVCVWVCVCLCLCGYMSDRY